MRILFMTSAHNSLSQRLLIELTGLGHQITVTIAASEDAMLQSVAAHRPDLIIAPMLKDAIPEAVWSHYTCLIVHPGIKGDRGPSSLDWAIMNSEETWGVTILQAAAEFDMGPVWAAREFSLGGLQSKSSVYHNEVTEAAVACVLEAVAKFESRQFQPEALDYSNPGIRGRLRPPMRQGDRAIDWSRDSTEAVVRRINAADSSPGVLDTLFGKSFFLYGAHEEERIKGAPATFSRKGMGRYAGERWMAPCGSPISRRGMKTASAILHACGDPEDAKTAKRISVSQPASNFRPRGRSAQLDAESPGRNFRSMPLSITRRSGI